MQRSVAPDGRVTIVGDSQAEIARGIQTARSARKRPLFVSLSYGEGSFLFSPYAQVLHGAHVYVLRAYSSIYVFDANGAAMRFGGAALDPQSLPEVDAGVLERLLRGCARCRFVERAASEYPALTDAWDGLRDPWQSQPLPPPWTSGAQLDAATNPR